VLHRLTLTLESVASMSMIWTDWPTFQQAGKSLPILSLESLGSACRFWERLTDASPGCISCDVADGSAALVQSAAVIGT
jgi:hypothetical protein